MLIKTFREIIAWQKAHQLTLEIYKMTEHFPKQETFALTNQIRRCAVSIPSNIAEGFKRRTKNDSLHFYNIAEGSLEELKYQLPLAHDLAYISAETYKALDDLAQETGKLINGWIKVQK